MSDAAKGGHDVPSAFLPGSHQAAAHGLVDFATVNSVSFKNRLLETSTAGVDLLILGFSRAFLAALHKRGWPFYAHTYVRSYAEQDRLFALGRSKARAGQSPHNHGLAVDIVHFKRGWDLTRKEWDCVGLVGKEVARTGFYRPEVKKMLRPSMVWGGDWKFWDPAHWELELWRERLDGDEDPDFRSAFKAARLAGLRTFKWKGRDYTTDLAD